MRPNDSPEPVAAPYGALYIFHLAEIL
jgi:hypothetical protein